MVLTLCLCTSLLPTVAIADNSPARGEAVEWLYAQEGIWHDLDEKYGAQCSDFVSAYTKPVSRADVAQMFINLLEQGSGKSVEALIAEKGATINKEAFTDTSDYAVLAANALGIINGTGNAKFSPNGTFTRAQIAAIINRVAGVSGIDTDGYSHSFTDVSEHWVSSELGWPSSVGIINGIGSGKFSPDTELTTEQAIAIAYRALQVLKK